MAGCGWGGREGGAVTHHSSSTITQALGRTAEKCSFGLHRWSHLIFLLSRQQKATDVARFTALTVTTAFASYEKQE